MGFVHIHRHGEFSALDGIGTANQYAERAAAIGQSALALTDHATLAGALLHIEACQEQGIKPIVGCEVYFREDRLTAKDRKDSTYYHLVLIAKNETGWRNLIRITSEAYRTGFYGKPCVDWALLERYGEGLIATAACMSGLLPKMMFKTDDKGARSNIQRMQNLFGEDFYIEIMPSTIEKQRWLNVQLIDIATEMSVPVIATCDAHFPYADWVTTQDVLLMISTRQTVSGRAKKEAAGEDVYKMGEPSLFLMSESEVKDFFTRFHPDLSEAVIAEAVSNTSLLADSITPWTIDRSVKMPKTKGAEDIVRTWCEEGLRTIGRQHDKAYLTRMEYEIDVLRDREAVDYFALVGGLTRWAKEDGIRYGVGRGSAAGCLVSYLIGITGIDPVAHGLVFERFLNPGRKGLPDIDIDFQHDRRDEVKRHLADEHGHDHVSEVCAWQRFGARGAIADCARVFDVSYEESLRITKQLDDTGLNLPELRKITPELDAFAKSHSDVWKHAVRLEGQVRTMSRHPAGVVVTNEPVDESLPLMRRANEPLVTSWGEGNDLRISDYGYVKIDALSTNGLTIQEHAVNMIEKRVGERPDIRNLPVLRDPEMADQEVLHQFARGRTLGVFQFESAGIRRLLRQVQPDHFRDIVAVNALFRPGPLQAGMADSYGARKRGEEPIEIWHEALEPFLRHTYGLVIYQEQVMEVVTALGDFTLGEADDIRRAMGKKDSTKLAPYRQQFIRKAESHGLTPSEAADVWDKIAVYSGYAFNVAHAASYGAQAYQDMWLKTNYPLEFYAAVAAHEPDKVAAVVREARSIGIPFLPPDVNTSEDAFGIDGSGIRYGLSSVKHVGASAVHEIFKNRPYTSLEDFKDRVAARACNSRVVDSLVASGAFDSLGERSEWDMEARANAERELLGVVISVAPISEEMQVVLHGWTDTPDEIVSAPDGERVTIGGEVVGVREISTKRGDRMAFVDILHSGETFGVTVFPPAWKKYQDVLAEGRVVVLGGPKDSSRDTIVARAVTDIDALVESLKERGDI